MLSKFQQTFTELISIIAVANTTTLSDMQIEAPNRFNWVRDIFEPLIVHRHGKRNLLELVSDNPSETGALTYIQGAEKCNQLLNFLRKQGVQQGDNVFIMCGLNESLRISYLSAIKGGLILIPAASILTANDIVYRFEKASPKVIIADKDNAEKMEQALLQYDHPVKVKLLLDGKRMDGCLIVQLTMKKKKRSQQIQIKMMTCFGSLLQELQECQKWQYTPTQVIP